MGNTTDKAGVMLFEANTNFVKGTPKNITIDVGNSGTSDANVVAIYIGPSESSMTSQGISSTTVSAGGITSFTIQYTWSAGKTYYFKVAPSSGQPLTFSGTAP